jgi:hypothetical protein
VTCLPAFLTEVRDEAAKMVLTVRLATLQSRQRRDSGQAEALRGWFILSDGSPRRADLSSVAPPQGAKDGSSVTPQARPYPPTQ